MAGNIKSYTKAEYWIGTGSCWCFLQYCKLSVKPSIKHLVSRYLAVIKAPLNYVSSFSDKPPRRKSAERMSAFDILGCCFYSMMKFYVPTWKNRGSGWAIWTFLLCRTILTMNVYSCTLKDSPMLAIYFKVGI